VTFDGTPGITVPANTLLLHPLAIGTPVDTIVQWTAPTTGTYAISGFFERIDNNPGAGVGVTYAVDVGGSPTDSGNIGSSDYTQYTFSYTEALTAGETVDFIVGPGSAFDDDSDSTGFDATITTATAVPEPASFAIFGIGLLGTIAARRRWTQGLPC
jgi:PEP-CTERM motif-containing protein